MNRYFTEPRKEEVVTGKKTTEPKKTREDYMREFEKRKAEEKALMNTLEIPAYEGRSLQAQWVQKCEHTEGSDWYAITGTSGWTAGCSKEVFDLLIDGKPFILETINLSRITGWIIDGKWYDRKSDQDLKREHEAFVANMERERRESLEAHHEEWQRRQDALPDWIRRRLEGFHQKAGEKFSIDGWGYELIIAELAVEYAALGDVIRDKDVFEVIPYESEAIKTISHEQGTSGNQHGMALALAKAHLDDPDRSMVGTISALAPLTGEAFYEGKKS